MIGYEMSSSVVWVYTMAKDCSGGELQVWMKKMTWLVNMTTLFARNFSPEVKFLGQSQTLQQETWPLENSNLRQVF